MRNWLKRALNESNPAAKGYRSDYDLNAEAKEQFLGSRALRGAAVLVPIVDHPSGHTVLLTKRADHLPKHAGQVSFPGGAIDPTDVDAVDAALREAEEEIGLDRSRVEIHGFLDRYRTGTGYDITPVVGLVKPGFKLKLQRTEVDLAFEVPLEFFLDRANHKLESAVWQGANRQYYAMPYGDHFIWGATAAMLVNLCDVLEAAKENAI